jgi:LacI family transcriptional regulator
LKKEATIYDIAKELKLSASTVSRALKDNKVINKETRKKVVRCAEKMGYRSNAFASNLRTRRTHTIGIIVPRLDSSFMSACLAGMEEIANEKGYNVIISQSHESVKKEQQNTTTMYNSRVDGIIASLTIEDSDLSYFNRFKEKNVPVVFFDRVPENTDRVCFVIDNAKISYLSTKHLIEQGCKNLAHITIKTNSNVYTGRIEGFLKAVKEHPHCEGNVLYADYLSLNGGRTIGRSILNSGKIPDGIFVANDMAAVGCMLELQENGVKIPDDVAIVGFNNDPVSTIISPQLSTITYPGREAGMLAAKSLIEHLDGENNIEHTRKVVLNADLLIRGSSLKK